MIMSDKNPKHPLEEEKK